MFKKDCWYPYPTSFVDFVAAIKTAKAAKTTASPKTTTKNKCALPSTLAQEQTFDADLWDPRRESLDEDEGAAATTTTALEGDEYKTTLSTAAEELQAGRADEEMMKLAGEKQQ